MTAANELAGTAFTLTDLVTCQPGAVVSRTLVDRKGLATLTLFAFAAGQGLSEHTAPFDAIIEVLDGQAEVVIDGTMQTVQAGQMLIMPANRPHSLHAPVDFKMLLTMIRA